MESGVERSLIRAPQGGGKLASEALVAAAGPRQGCKMCVLSHQFRVFQKDLADDVQARVDKYWALRDEFVRQQVEKTARSRRGIQSWPI